jgi:hypothetical protein
MTTLKTLLVAAALAATCLPAKAAERPSLGMVDFGPLPPVACRNLDDAIAAAGRFNSYDAPDSRDLRAKLDFVRPHQIGSRVGPYGRIRPKGDCVIAQNEPDGRPEFQPLFMAVEIRAKAPGLPVGMIAVCARAGSLAKNDCDEGDQIAFPSYWVVIDPVTLMRNFDLPKGN